MERLFEVESSELRGEGDSELARHLSECVECRRAADKILAMEGDLSGWLGKIEEGHAAGEVVPFPPPVVGEPREVRLPSGRPRRLWTVGLPAVAAGLVGLLFFEGRPGEEVDSSSLQTAQAGVAEIPPLVESAPGKNVIVLETQDPEITLVWLY